MRKWLDGDPVILNVQDNDKLNEEQVRLLKLLKQAGDIFESFKW